MESPYKSAPDSPSRQLLWELGRLSVNEQERLYERLDLDAEERESLHRRALERAAAEHERVRHEAEVEQRRLETARALERERKALQEERELHRLNQQRAEEKARFEQEQAEQEAAARRAAEDRKREEAARAEREQHERERAAEAEQKREAEQREQERQSAEAEAKAKEAAIAARKKQAEAKEAAPSAPAEATRGVNGISSVSRNERPDDAGAEHDRYLAIWRRLKELRNFVKEYSKTDADFKKAMGDGRRVIRKCVGQLVTDSTNTQANRQPNLEIRNVLRDSHKFTSPTVPLAGFLHTLPSDISQPDIPALFLYLLNVFSKCLIGQFIGEVAIAPRTATTIGITGGTIFSQNDCQWHGHSLIDIFIAKYHRVCPVLFGVYGNDKTGAGKSRIGWWMDGGAYVTEQRHYERMTGLGAGFASMVLRSYRNRQSPYPAWHFWQATSRILNVSKDRVTATHLVVLKAMVEGNEQRILEFFGRAGLVLLRVALKEFPASLPIRDGVAAKALLLIPDVLRAEKKLFL